MSQLFLVLAGINLIALVVTFVVGCLSAFFQVNIYVTHFTLGLYTSIGTLLVHCIIFTYFLGTGRWVKEVVLAYRMPDEPYHKATRELKRKVFPPALFAMLIAIATSAAGAGAQLAVWHWTIHFTLAILTLVINVWAYGVEYRCLQQNAAVLDGVLVEVDKIRAERGLPTNAEALQQERSEAR